MPTSLFATTYVCINSCIKTLSLPDPGTYAFDCMLCLYEQDGGVV